MKSLGILVLALMMAAATSLRALPFQRLNGLPSPAPAAEGNLPLAGQWGVGFDTIPGASAGTGLLPGLAQPNAVSLRHWFNEKFALEGKLAFSATSQPTGVSGTSVTSAWGVGTQMKYNIARPSQWLLAQFLGGASLAQLGQSSTTPGTPVSSDTGATTTTFNIMVGLGFEAFVPVWQSLSLEGSIGLNVGSVQTKSAGAAQATQSSSSIGINGNGFTPLNVAIHYYF